MVGSVGGVETQDPGRDKLSTPGQDNVGVGLGRGTGPHDKQPGVRERDLGELEQ